MRLLGFVTVVLLGLSAVIGLQRRPETSSRVRTWISAPFEIDRAYPSMMGPQQVEFFTLDPQSRQLAWLTGFSARTVNADTDAADGQRYLCHTNLILPNPEQHVQRLVGDARPRLFTVSQGQEEFQLPEGFGIPVRLDTPMMFDGQVLNKKSLERPAKIRQVVDLSYVLQSELDRPLKPLLCRMVGIMREIEDYQGQVGQVRLMDGDGCGLVENADWVLRTPKGKAMVGHWTVPPGRKEYRLEVTGRLSLPYDTTLHMATLHVHPYCESVELRDLTTGQAVVRLLAHRSGDGTRPFRVEQFSDVAGIPLFKDHRYEVVSVYNNDSGETQDAMVNIFLFLHDKQFDLDAAVGQTEPAAGDGGAS